MNTSKKELKPIHEQLWFRILTRIFGFPIFLYSALTLILILLIKYMYNYILYGGEALTYTHKVNPKTIVNILPILEEIKENYEIFEQVNKKKTNE